jgi:APA family basic amino acid/polyamine antiporter
VVHGPIPSSGARYRLLRVLGAGFGLAVTFGGVIGMGILRQPGQVATHLPHVGLFLAAWVAGGAYALLGTLSVAELAAMIPRSGGFYVFARRAFGPYPAFVVGWTDWLSVCGTTAGAAIYLGEYAAPLISATAGAQTAVALGAVLAFGVLQWQGIRLGGATQDLTSLLKGLAFLALVASFFALGPRHAVPREGMAWHWPALTAVVLALQALIYTYDGWYNPIYFGEEVEEPGRTQPRAMIGGILSVTAIYLLLNAAVLYVLPIDRLAGQELAIGAAAEAVFGARAATVVSGLTIISMLSLVNANNLMAPRVLYALSRDGLFWKHGTAVNRGGTPTVALVLSTLAALAFIVTGTVDQVIAVLAFFMVTNYTLAFVALFVLRRREPDLARPYRVPLYPWLTGAVLALSLAYLAGAVWSDQENSVYALLVLGASYPAYRLLRWWFGGRAVLEEA